MRILLYYALASLAAQVSPPAGVDPIAGLDCLPPGPGDYRYSMSADLAWAPDGAHIFHSRGFGQQMQLRKLNVATGQERCLTSAPYNVFRFSVTPDEQVVYFGSDHEGSMQIYRMDLASGNVQKLPLAGRRLDYPTLSPDGGSLAYVRYSGPTGGAGVLMVRRLATGIERELFTASDGLNFLRWTNDGSGIHFFAIDSDGWNDNYLATADGSEVQRLTDNTVTDDYSWADTPDDLAYSVGRGAERDILTRFFNYELYEYEKATGVARRLTWAIRSDDRQVYSPDGSQLAWASGRNGYTEIYLMERSGNGIRQLTTQPNTELVTFIRGNGVVAGLEYYHRTRSRDPDAQMFSEMGARVFMEQLLAQHRIEDALAFGKVFVETYPSRGRAWTAYGLALWEAGREAEALGAFGEALARDPRQHQIAYKIGGKRFVELLAANESLWTERPGELLGLTRAEFLNAGDLHTGIDILRELLKRYPDDVDVLYTYGFAYMYLGLYDDAVAAFRKVLSADPQHQSARFHLARIEHLARP